MTDADFNPDDAGLLASRDLDGDLSGDERRRLGDALDASESLRADADAMRRVNELVHRWAAAPAELDWDAYAALIDARCRAGRDAQDRPELDGLLKRWARSDVAHDDEQFTTDVMRRVGAGTVPARKEKRNPWIYRLGVPLAAAAVLAFALIGGSWMNRDDGTQGIAPGVVAELPLGVTKVPTCIVRFVRESPSEAPELPGPEARRPSGVSFTAFGVATVGIVAAPPVP